MLTISKYEVPMNQEFNLILPIDHKILKIDLQQVSPVIWVLIDTENDLETNKFFLYTSDTPITESIQELTYIGSFVMNTFEGHLFQRK